MKRGRGRIEFWTSVEYGTFLPALVACMGPGARQRFSVSMDDYRNARGALARLWMRWRCYAVYPIKLVLEAIRLGRGETMVVCSNTFYAPVLAVGSARRGAVIHWVLDLFPDVLVAAGSLKAESLVERVLWRCIRATFDRAAANVFLGERLRAYAVERFGEIPRSVVIPIGCDATPFLKAVPQELQRGENLRILYCGNFGRMHDLDTIRSLIMKGLPERVELAFRGNGAGFACLRRLMPEGILPPRVQLGASLSEGEWVAEMMRAQVALVTLRQGAEGLLMPSKTYSAMGAGQAILAVCPRDSELADAVVEIDCGLVVEPDDVAGLEAAIVRLRDDQGLRLRFRMNAWHAGQERFDQRVIAQSWRRVIDGILSQAGGCASTGENVV